MKHGPRTGSRLALAGVILLALGMQTVSGSHIALQVSPTVHGTQDGITVKADITNRGDEPAMNVRLEAGLGSRRACGSVVHTLGVRQSSRHRIELGPLPDPPGAYTVVLKTRYEDANGYPFSSLKSVPLLTGDPGRTAPARMEVWDADVRRDGGIRVAVRAPPDAPLDADVSLVLPDEWRCPRPVRAVKLKPGDTKALVYAVENRGALPGSRYGVMAVADYVQAGAHRTTTATAVLKVPPSLAPVTRRVAGTVAALLLLAAWCAASLLLPARDRPAPRGLRLAARCLPGLVLAVLAGFTLAYIPPRLLFLDTLTVGGDTPAHHYLASHLKQQLFSEGRLVSWAPGWWCGFPAFQFYFCLPYLLVALAGLVIPFNIAFKLVTVSGILLLPASAYAGARLARLPRPVPSLMAVVMLPLLFDVSHTMWGVNIYSTFAGMISNSVSFPLMLLFLGSALRDSDDGRFRCLTVFLFTALLCSHFFTSLVAGVLAMCMPCLAPRAGFRRAFQALAAEGALAALLMAWWLLPLVARRQYAVAFGLDWDVGLVSTLPFIAVVPLLAAMMTVVLLLVLPAGKGTREKVRRGLAQHRAVARFAGTLLIMLLFSGLLFKAGTRMCPVFVNVRFWPFIVYACLALSAVAIGAVLTSVRYHALGVLAALAAILAWGTGQPERVLAWAKWNYEGLQSKRTWPVWERLILPLRGTPGRLANDLHAANQALGSSRIFECVPHMIGKPVLEGGLVNSAVGSLFAYYVQSETSDNCAGLPNIVQPVSFNIGNATRHLELFNVKHFVARSPRTRDAMLGSPAWELLGSRRGWSLFELTTHEGAAVAVLPRRPPALRTAGWKQAGLEWLYNIQALDRPVVLLDPDEEPPPATDLLAGEAAFRRYLAGGSAPGTDPPLPYGHVTYISATAGDAHRLRFRTEHIGRPHIVKRTYYPTWKVRGAARVYRVTPCFMLVYPEQEEVELYFGWSLVDIVGKSASWLGLALLALAAYRVKNRQGVS